MSLPNKVIAVDVAILLEGELKELAIRLNKEIHESNPASYTLGEDRKPHITTGMGFVREKDIPRLIDALDAVLKDVAGIDIHFASVEILDNGRHSDLKIERTENLMSLHGRVMDVFVPFETTYLDDLASYVLDEGESPSKRSIYYQQEYRKLRGLEHYKPHVTLGKGAPVTQDVSPRIYDQHRIALCRMGAHGNCRDVIHEWHLP
ncbi:MAG: 2'-5' RNA ligase family protein [Parcubacteria group bacterium]